MDLEMVLNELSLSVPAQDIFTARQWMSQFIQTIRQATQYGIARSLRTTDEVNHIFIAPDYPISRWRNDKEVDLEEIRFFKSLTTKSPLLLDIADQIEEEVLLSEIQFQDELAKSLGFALIIDGLAVSLPSEPRWNFDCLELTINRLNAQEELIDSLEQVKHASHIDHVKNHKNWIELRIKNDISNGLELWNRREELFPHLSFCDNIREQLQNFTDQRSLRQCIDKLGKLEEYSQKWSEGNFDDTLLGNCSPETQITLERYADERTFKCPDGGSRLFSWHLKISRYRIYFYPEGPAKKIIVGYIGFHLPTAKYPN